MRYKLTKLSAVLLFCIRLAGLHAQEAIPASGGNASGSGGSVSYTFGQVYYISIEGINGTVAQGVQQPYEISVVTRKNGTKEIHLICYAYPNPTYSDVKLVVDNLNTKDMIYQLYDINGKLLESKKVEGSETLIDMSNLIVASYILKVSLNNKEIETFKIIKY